MPDFDWELLDGDAVILGYTKNFLHFHFICTIGN